MVCDKVRQGRRPKGTAKDIAKKSRDSMRNSNNNISLIPRRIVSISN